MHLHRARPRVEFPISSPDDDEDDEDDQMIGGGAAVVANRADPTEFDEMQMCSYGRGSHDGRTRTRRTQSRRLWRLARQRPILGRESGWMDGWMFVFDQRAV